MKTFIDRFEEILDFTGITPYRLAKEIDTSDVIISRIRSGKTKPSFEFLAKLVDKYPLFDLNYLLTGEGELLKKTGQSSPQNQQNNTSFQADAGIKIAKTGKTTAGKTNFVTQFVTPTVTPGTKKHTKQPVSYDEETTGYSMLLNEPGNTFNNDSHEARITRLEATLQALQAILNSSFPPTKQ